MIPSYILEQHYRRETDIEYFKKKAQWYKEASKHTLNLQDQKQFERLQWDALRNVFFLSKEEEKFHEKYEIKKKG